MRVARAVVIGLAFMGCTGPEHQVPALAQHQARTNATPRQLDDDFQFVHWYCRGRSVEVVFDIQPKADRQEVARQVRCYLLDDPGALPTRMLDWPIFQFVSDPERDGRLWLRAKDVWALVYSHLSGCRLRIDLQSPLHQRDRLIHAMLREPVDALRFRPQPEDRQEKR